MKKNRVLWVDSEALSEHDRSESLREWIMEECEVVFVIAQTVEEAEKTLKEEKFSFIITESWMNGKRWEGLSFIQKLREGKLGENISTVPVVIFSTSFHLLLKEDPERVKRIIGLPGKTIHIKKPTDIFEFKKEIESILNT